MKFSNQQCFISMLLITACLGCSTNKNVAIKAVSNTAYGETSQYLERIDGDKLVNELLEQRFVFNKKVIKDGFAVGMALPKPKSIMNRHELTSITFGALSYLIKDSKILGVHGIPLTPTALNAINSRMTKFDMLQQYCAERTNNEYSKPNRDLQYIKTLDRQYFSSLKSIRLITSYISSLSRKPNPSVSIEMSVASIKFDEETEFINKQIGKALDEANQAN